MNETTAERLEMRWLPVIDAAGRTRMEATWVAVPAAAAAPEPASHARRLRRHDSSSEGRAHRALGPPPFRARLAFPGDRLAGIEPDCGPLQVIEG